MASSRGPAIERPRTPPKFTSAGFSAIAAVAGGSYHTCAVASGGYVWCWGSNSNGQLGIESTADQHSPVAVMEMGVKTIENNPHPIHTFAGETARELRWKSTGKL